MLRAALLGGWATVAAASLATACSGSSAMQSAAGGVGGAVTSSSSSAHAATSSSGGDGGPSTVVTHPSGTPLPGETTCTVVETTGIPEPDFTHLPMCTPIDYATDPPSGGNHWPIWAAYKIYTEPAPREMTVHDLEHGAIVISYHCPSPCPEVVAALTKVFDGVADPECLMMPGPPARMVLTPDPLLGTPIAAASWGATYTATCIDTASLQAFATAHYNHGREDFCTDGQDVQAMPPCVDGGSG